MKTQAINSQKTARFRRWSRTSYAIFRSLSCCVTIGVLTVSISNKSEAKSHSFITKTQHITDDSAVSEFDEADLFPNQQTLVTNIIKEQSTDNAAAARCTSTYFST